MDASSRRQFLLALAAAGVLPASQARAATFPEKPIRIVVPYPPGGGGDTQTRMLAQVLSADIGQPVIVDNRAGANGALGSRQVAGAPADGYTLLFTTATQLLLTPLVGGDAGYTANDFIPVAGMSSQSMIVVVPANSPIKTMADLIQRGKAADAKLSYGASSIGSLSHIVGERLNAVAGTRYLAVPYKGTGQLMTAILSGEVDYTYIVGSAAAGHLKSGSLRALAVVDKVRSPSLPDVPTIKEATGLDGFTTTAWFGIVAPARTPKPVIDLLSQKISAVFRRPDIRAKLEAESAIAWPAGPDEMAAVLKADAPVYAEAAKTIK
jgi:tripartite-type tricarboxylate transporter receptor subunit TctC